MFSWALTVRVVKRNKEQHHICIFLNMCKSHDATMQITWFCFHVDVANHKTFITDRGPPTFGDGIFPKQVISSVTQIVTNKIDVR